MQTIKRELNEDGVLTSETWMCDGQLHRTDGPAFLALDVDGNMYQETWYIHGENQGTCHWSRHPNGSVSLEHWWCYNKESLRDEHRTDGPAVQRWSPDGTLVREVWFLNGNLHRTDGPAARDWSPNGTLLLEKWYQNGKEISKRAIVLARARAKVLRSSRLLTLASAVQCVSADSLSVIGGFL